MKIKEKKYNWYLKLGLSLIVVIMLYSLNLILNPFSTYWTELLTDKDCFIFNFCISFLSGWLIIEISIFISNMLEHRLTWTGSPVLRFVVQTLLIILSVVILLFLQDRVFILIYGDIKLSQQELLENWQFLVSMIIISLFVSIVHTSFYLLNRWKKSISEASELRVKALKLKEVAMQAELQSLKIQLDPHFMFNNFSTLSDLINENSDIANLFLENLSRVYRYMIQNLKKNTIALAEEVAFVKAYCYLIHIRYSDNVQVNIDLDKSIMQLNIPPISLQLLVENAIKHNMATKDQPLIITITSNGNQSLKVCNNLQRISHPFPSTGVGLQNIIDRYCILSESHLPEIVETVDKYCVTLPLLNFNE